MFAVFLKDANGIDYSELQAADKTEAGNPLMDLEPGAIERLPIGTDVDFANPPQYTDPAFETKVVRAIAQALSVSYEELAFDLSLVNFSSGRMGWQMMHRAVECWRWHMIIPQLCTRVGQWALEAMAVEAPQLQPMQARIDWTPPRRELVDPSREVPAIIDQIRAGLMSRSQALREYGLDPAKVRAEIAADNAADDAAGIIVDSDPRKVAAGGALQGRSGAAPTG